MADTLITGTTIIEDTRAEFGKVWSCAGTNFGASSPDVADISKGNEGDLTVTSFTGNFTAPVFLPHGRKILKAVVFGSNAGDTWKLVRAPINSADSTNDTIATAATNTEDVTITTNEIIDNQNFRYIFQVQTLTDADELFGARINYE